MARNGALTRNPKQMKMPRKSELPKGPSLPKPPGKPKKGPSLPKPPGKPKKGPSLPKPPGKPKSDVPPPPRPEKMQFSHAQNQTAYNALTPKQQAKYRKLRANKGAAKANKYLGKTSGQAVVLPGGKTTKPATPPAPAGPPNEPPPGVPYEQLTPQQQMGELADVGGSMYQQMAGYSAGFNPQTFQQQYEPVYSQEMERARQNVMGQFERRNADQFARERQDVQQQIAERGLDPNSEAAQAMYKQLNVRQDLARQEAMSSAEQAAQGVQQQMYQQATGVAMMPGEIQQQYEKPWQLQYGQAASLETLAKQQEYAKQLAAQQQKYALQQIKATPRGHGGGGGGGMSAFDQYMLAQTMGRYGQQPPSPNPVASGTQGFVQGVGTGVTATLVK